jgi:hypothetical protein
LQSKRALNTAIATATTPPARKDRLKIPMTKLNRDRTNMVWSNGVTVTERENKLSRPVEMGNDLTSLDPVTIPNCTHMAINMGLSTWLHQHPQEVACCTSTTPYAVVGPGHQMGGKTDKKRENCNIATAKKKQCICAYVFCAA